MQGSDGPVTGGVALTLCGVCTEDCVDCAVGVCVTGEGVKTGTSDDWLPDLEFTGEMSLGLKEE
jgi:hypothetical protein